MAMTFTNGPTAHFSAAQAQTDNDGRFQLTLPTGKGSVEVVPPSAPGVAGYGFSPRVTPPENIHEVEVVPGRARPRLVFSIAPPEAGSDRSPYASGGKATTGSFASGTRRKGTLPFPPARVRSPIEGKVVGPDGRPVADAIVGLQPWFESQFIVRNENRMWGGDIDKKILAKRFVRTDASGRFALKEVGVDEWGAIEVIHRERHLVGLAELPASPRPGTAELPLTIWLSAAGSVSGSAKKEGQPCPGVRVRIEETPLRVVFGRSDDDLKPDYLTGSALEMSPSLAAFKDSTETDPQGRFQFATVPANKEFTVRIYARDLVAEKNRYSVR